METRTSHSSPCFLRVADASAASSASKMISLSTLFSFDTASTTSRISLFITRTPYSQGLAPHSKRRSQANVVRKKNLHPSQRRESRSSYLRELYAHGEVVHIHLDALAVRSAQHARISLAPIARHTQLHLHAFTHELREVLGRAQHAVQSR